MSTTIETIYKGNYTCATQSPLHAEPIITKAVSYTPMDMLITAYGSCLLATIDYEARKANFSTPGIRSSISYAMSADGSRLGAIEVSIHVDSPYTEEQKAVIEHAANNKCHVGKSLDPTIVKQILFIYN